MTVLKLPLLTDYTVYDFQNTTIGGYIKNGYVEDKNGRTVVINRPAIDSVFTLPTNPVSLKFWDRNSALYSLGGSFPNYTLYKGTTPTSLGVVPMGGSVPLDGGKVFWAEIDSYLCASVAWSGSDFGGGFILTNTDTHSTLEVVNFPSNTERLAGGLVSMDGYLFVMGGYTGRVFNSNLNDPYTWNALDYIGTDLAIDSGVYIAKYKNHIVAFGNQSAEFFYNAGNAVGSPLALRKDIGLRVGCHSVSAAYEDSNYLAWVARTADGDIYVAEMDNFSPRKISTSVIDTNLFELIESAGGIITLSGMPLLGRVFLFLYLKPTSMAGITFVYDTKAKLWYKWNFNGTNVFPVCSRSLANGLDPMYCMLLGGTRTGVHEVKVGQFVDTYTGVSTDIDFQIITPIYRGPEGTDTFLKFVHKLTLMADKTATSAIVYISWTDDNFQTWSPERQIDLQALRGIHRLGHFRERAFKLRCPANIKRIVESLNIDVLIEAT